MGDVLTIAGETVPFDLFGLSGNALAPMTVAGVGHHAETVNLVALGHGDRWKSPHEWVQVAVTGPLHGVTEHGVWSMDPTPMIASELLSAAGVAFATTEQVTRGIHALIARGYSDTELDVDGTAELFQVIREGEHWAALRRVEPDHLLYVLASKVPFSQVALRRLRDLNSYSSSAGRD